VATRSPRDVQPCTTPSAATSPLCLTMMAHSSTRAKTRVAGWQPSRGCVRVVRVSATVCPEACGLCPGPPTLSASRKAASPLSEGAVALRLIDSCAHIL
jgi:hypothetical protein